MKHTARAWGWRAVGLTVTGVGLYVVAPSLIAVLDQWPDLQRVRPLWFVFLVLLEAGSMAALWFLLRITLPTTPWFVNASSQLAGNAAAKVLPGGNAAGSVVQASMLVRGGQSEGCSGHRDGEHGPADHRDAARASPPDRARRDHSSTSGPAAAAGSGGLPGDGRPADRAGLRAAEVGPLRPRGRPRSRAGAARRTTAISVSSVADTVTAQRDTVAAAFDGHWLRALAYAAANRMLDYAALVASLYAVGARARPSMVLLAYVIALGLALIPLTPGGLGFVEAGLTTILVLAGVSADQAVLGTLLYRLISFWLPIPIGALAWAGWRLHPTAASPPVS